MSAERTPNEDLKVFIGKTYTADDFSFRFEAQSTVFTNFGHEVKAHELTKVAQEAQRMFDPTDIIISGEDSDGSTIIYGIGSAGWIANPTNHNKPC